MDDVALQGYREAAMDAVSAQLDSPVRIILTLFNESLAAIARAQAALRCADSEEFKEQVIRGMTIIEGLRMHLDYSRGGEVAASLGRVYDCVVARLLEAHRQRDAGLLQEAERLVEVVRDAWGELLGPQHA
jgi:flagellar protein FliS